MTEGKGSNQRKGQRTDERRRRKSDESERGGGARLGRVRHINLPPHAVILERVSPSHLRTPGEIYVSFRA